MFQLEYFTKTGSQHAKENGSSKPQQKNNSQNSAQNNWKAQILNTAEQAKEKIRQASNKAGDSWNKFWNSEFTTYPMAVYGMVPQGIDPTKKQRSGITNGQMAKLVTGVTAAPAIAASTATVGTAGTIGGLIGGTLTGTVGKKVGEKSMKLIGANENAQKMAGDIGGFVGGMQGGAGSTNVINQRNRIIYNGTYPFNYNFKNHDYLEMAKSAVKTFFNPFKKTEVLHPLQKKMNEDFRSFLGDKRILSRDAALRKAFNIEPTAEGKGLYYDRTDGTVGINYTHPLAGNRDRAAVETAKQILNNDRHINDAFTAGGNGGLIGVKNFVNDPETGTISFTTFDKWDLQPFYRFKFLPKAVRELEFVKLSGGKPFNWRDTHKVTYSNINKEPSHNFTYDGPQYKNAKKNNYK